MSAIAVIATGGKQYIVEAGRFLLIEKITGLNEGDTVTFDIVLLYDDGTTTDIGAPHLSKKVTGKVMEVGRDKKRVVIKYKAKSRYFKKRGHRQPHLKVMIEKV